MVGGQNQLNANIAKYDKNVRYIIKNGHKTGINTNIKIRQITYIAIIIAATTNPELNMGFNHFSAAVNVKK
jgi:hypothetical protein